MGVVTSAAATSDSAAGDPGSDPLDESTDGDSALVTGMTDLLIKAVRALGAAGEPEQASRLAGKAWWVLKDWPRHAERVNGTMHYLARLEQNAEQGTPDEPSR
ncbi:MAG: hypothetical protein ABI034_08250 [Nakamurella sp.]